MRSLGDTILIAGVIFFILGAINYFTGFFPSVTPAAAAALGFILVGAGVSLKKRDGS